MLGRKKQVPHENHERWLVSYADFITLLFAFFVVMFASSQTDKSKARQVSASVTKAFEVGNSGAAKAAVAKVLGGTVDDVGQGNAMMKGPGGSKKSAKREEQEDEVVELIPSLKRLTKELAKEIENGEIDIRMEPRGLVVSLHEKAFFPSGSDVIEIDQFPTMQKLAKALTAVPNPVRFEGHTDSIPIRTPRFRNNWELSSARGIAMLEMFHSKFGIDKSRMAVIGNADTMPNDSNDTEEGRLRNRHVDVVILSHLGLQASPGKTKRPASSSPQSSPMK